MVSTLESSPDVLVLAKRVEVTDGAPRRMGMADGLPNALEGVGNGTGPECHLTERIAILHPQGGTLLQASASFGE